jgi:hypothetical protein
VDVACDPADKQGRGSQNERNTVENKFIKEKIMSKKPDNRVLSRQLARDLTQEELEIITGGFFTSPNRDVTTTFCTLASDGDDD